MKARATILLVLIVSLALAPVLAATPVHAASGPYTERLDLYTAGSNSLWTISLDRLGATLPSLATVDSTSGLTSYRLVAMSTQSATSDFQVFGTDGYNLLNLPSYPSQGLFLTVAATSPSAASSVAAALGSQFGTTFALVSSSGENSTYFAPVDFVNTALPILYKLVPTSEGGFASLVAQSTFGTLAMPFIELTGVNNGSGFSHLITVGAASSSIITASTGVIDLSEIIGSTNATVSTSANSTSSLVVVHSLDSMIVSSDSAATVSNHPSNVSGSYSLPVAAGKHVDINATVTSAVPTLVAYRSLDHGSISENGTLGVTIYLINTASAGTLDNVTVNDNWWQSYQSDLAVASGSDSGTISTIAANSSRTLTYALKVTSSSATQITIPPVTVTYTYHVSSVTYTGEATIGQQVLQLNQVGPALSVTAKTTMESGSALGTAGNYTVTVTNNGNSPVLNVRVGNYTVNNIAANGGSSTIDIPVQPTSLSQSNFSKVFTVEYTSTTGASQNLTTNSVPLLLSHTSMVIPFVTVATNDSLTASALTNKTAPVTYTFTNSGKGSPSSVTATESLPQGVTCSVKSGVGGCNGNTYSMTVTSLTTQKNTLDLNFSDDNYVVPPTDVVATYEGMQLHSFGGAYEIPAGLGVTKSFSPDSGFPGTGSTVTVGVTNQGTTPVYNVSLSSGFDSFDEAANSSATTQATYAQLAPGSSQSFTYPVKLTGASYGNLTGVTVSTRFLLGGAVQTLGLGQSRMTVYAPVTATLVTSPSSPEEGHNFQLTVTITNSAAVNVSNVVYTFTLPSGVGVVSGATVSDHKVTLTLPSMQPDSNQNITLTMSASGGLTIDTSSSHLTFQYLGATLTGVANAKSIVVSVDTTTRYELPIAVAVVIGILAVVLARRKVNPVAKP